MRKRKESPAAALTPPQSDGSVTEEDSSLSSPVVIKKKSNKRTYSVTCVTPTNGGHIVDLSVTNFEVTTVHTMTISQEWQDLIDPSLTPEQLAKLTMRLLLDKGMKISNTEGMIDAAAFPINYFSAKQVEYFYPEAAEVLKGYVQEKGEGME